MNRWPLRKAPFWAEAPLFHLLLPLIVAIICYDRGWLAASSWWLSVSVIALVILLLLTFIRIQTALTKGLFFVLLYGMVFCFGSWRSQSLDSRQLPNWFAKQKDSTALSFVKILDDPSAKERIWRMRIAVVKSCGAKGAMATSGEAFLNIYKKDTVFPFHKGDFLLVPAQWQELSNSGNPFEVDYKTMNRRRNICHQQFLALEDAQLYEKGHQGDAGILERTHQYCDVQLRHYLKDSATYGLLQAMLLGDERNFDPELRQAYSDTGVIHIVSISGSHVGVLFGVIVLLLSRIKGRKGQWLRFVIGLLVIWFYVLMAGAPPSALRAALMFSVIAFGTAFSKEAHPLNTLFAAAIALLCANPMWLFSVGFQLSFGAVLSLLLFYNPVYKLWPQTHWLPRWLWAGAVASFAAEILTAPLVIYYFHNFPLFFLPANLFAALLLGVLALLGGMLIIVLSPVAPLASALAWCITQVVHVFNWMIRILQSWNPVSFKYLQISPLELLAFYIAITGLAIYMLKQYRSALWLGLSAMVLMLSMLCIDRLNVLHQDRLIVYNVSRHDHIERVHGPYFQTIQTDTSKAELFTAALAHTGWGAWHPMPALLSNYFILADKKIIILNNGINAGDTATIPADILLITYPLKALKPQQLMNAFHPQLIVAGGNQPRWVIQKWKDECNAMHLPFHAVSQDGAYILP